MATTTQNSANRKALQDIADRTLQGESQVGCFYKNTGVFITTDLWKLIVKENMSSEIPTDAIFQQLEVLKERIEEVDGSAITSGQIAAGQKVDDVNHVIIFVANLAELILKRKVLKNDDANGFLSIKVAKKSN